MLTTEFTRKYRSHAALTAAALLAMVAGPGYADDSTDSHNHAQHEIFLDEKAWITNIGALLYSDADADGYFSGLSLSIDADTQLSSYEVYATIDLVNERLASGHFDTSDTGELSSERLHTTQRFDLYGDSASDEYRIDIELAQNYAPGTYDLSIALIDAHDDQILDQVGAQDFRNLRSLSLESEDFQSIHIPVVERPVEPVNDDIRVTEYAGSAGFGILFLFLMTLLLRRVVHASPSIRHYTCLVEVPILTSLTHTERSSRCQNTNVSTTNL